jgi:hypothetical protein
MGAWTSDAAGRRTTDTSPPSENTSRTGVWALTKNVILQAEFKLLLHCRPVSPERSVSWKTRKHGRCGNLGEMSVARAVEQKEQTFAIHRNCGRGTASNPAAPRHPTDEVNHQVPVGRATGRGSQKDFLNVDIFYVEGVVA